MWGADEVRQRLAELGAADPELRRFGAPSHRYQLKPPLTEEQVRAFEERHGIKLPEDYRDFLLQVANGGAGPCYGLFPLSDLLDPDGRDVERVTPGEDFPHAEAWNCTFPPQAPDESDDDHRRRYEAHEERYFATAHVAGSIALCHYGCGDILRLVVSGPQYGTVWQDGRGGDYGIWPLHQSFREWYDQWLRAETY